MGKGRTSGRKHLLKASLDALLRRAGAYSDLRCEGCGNPLGYGPGAFHVHHVEPESDDLQILCPPCHEAVHRERPHG